MGLTGRKARITSLELEGMYIEILDGTNWQEFLSEGIAVLMLGKTTCAACNEWTEELDAWDSPFEGIKIAKIHLDQPGLGRFKIAQPWVSEVEMLPFNAIFVDGEVVKQWAGGGISRLENRLQRFMS